MIPGDVGTVGGAELDSDTRDFVSSESNQPNKSSPCGVEGPLDDNTPPLAAAAAANGLKGRPTLSEVFLVGSEEVSPMVSKLCL